MNFQVLRSREMALLSDFLHDLYAPVARERFAGHVVDLCARHLREFVTTTAFDQTHLRTHAYAAACNRADELAPHLPALGAHIHEHPGWAYAAAGGPERVLMITDFLTQRQWRRTELFQCGFRQMKTMHQLAVALPGPTHLCGLTLMRDRPLPEELRVLMHLLSPHLERAHALAQRRTEAPPLFDPAAAALTGREAEVLHWVAQGKRDAEVATILGIAPRTVSKHVEHILAKLGVETRGAAVATVKD